ncbi:MAG TPA: GIY-YIG nuclease family protein [Gammaproteobacteria bacterium]|nr:GIY-YIG nuclease family protein [Gammaproteobacteria bacterium]
MRDGGAYRLFLQLTRPAWVRAGRLDRFRLEPGLYIYVGSARRALAARVDRHRRLAERKHGNRHWHVDGLLLHGYSRLVRAETYPDTEECALSRGLAGDACASVPIAGFGATDCRAGCPAHLYRLEPDCGEPL